MNVVVTAHAIERWQEYFNPEMDRRSIHKKILTAYAEGKRIKRKAIYNCYYVGGDNYKLICKNEQSNVVVITVIKNKESNYNLLSQEEKELYEEFKNRVNNESLAQANDKLIALNKAHVNDKKSSEYKLKLRKMNIVFELLTREQTLAFKENKLYSGVNLSKIFKDDLPNEPAKKGFSPKIIKEVVACEPAIKKSRTTPGQIASRDKRMRALRIAMNFIMNNDTLGKQEVIAQINAIDDFFTCDKFLSYVNLASNPDDSKDNKG